MAAGDIIFEDGTIVTPNDMENLMQPLVALISSTQKDVGQYEEVKSLQGVSSLPVFQQAGNVYKLVRVAVELLKGVDGREIYLQVNADRTYIQWRWTDGVWQNLYKIEDLRGEPVVLRTGSQGIEWKYRDEADTAWRMLVTYDVLKLKYSDLTPEQVEDLWRHLPADVLAQFQKPATDAAAEVRKKMDGITEEANTLMDDVRELESSVSTAESGRVNAEKGRVDAESARRVAEVNRENSEDERETAEIGRANAESTRVSNENLRKTAETGRVNAENTRVSQENARKTAETGRVDAEKARVTAENKRVSEFATLKQNAETATANANDTANHPTYIGEDNYVYKWNKATKAYDKTDIYVKGDAFSIKKVYASVAALQADVNNSDIKVGDFVLVNTNNVEDPDNAKLYVKVQNTNGSYAYDFLVDMSGAIGFTGKTPQFSIGTVSSGVTPAVTLSENGVDSNGNPRYKLNLVLPKGEKGEAPILQIGTITTGTPGGSASASITANGSTSEGAPIFKLNMTIPQGPQGKGNVSVVESGLLSGKTYLFKPSANNSATGTLVDADEKYLKLTGGTMTDRIHFNSTAPDTRFIDFYEGSGYLGSMGIDATKLVLNNHISGSQLQLRNDGEIWYRNQKVWYAGNDGSGSGLDADTVDGLQATSFLRRDISHTQDLNNIVTSGFVENNKNVDAKPEWHYPIKQAGVLIAGLSANFRTNQIYGTYLNRWFARGAGEAESGLDGYTDWKEFAFLDANGKVSKAIIADSANSVAWNNVASKPSWIGANKPTYTASEVGALPSGGTAVAATKLATARTINGVSFDGTSNITITAAANGGNSATVGGYSNSAILTTRAAPVNIDSTDSAWNSTYNPSSGGTKPTTGYGLVTQFNNIQGGAPGNGGVYVSQLGFDAGGSVFYRNRYDTTAWSTWKQFIFNDDSRLTNARPANGGTSAACSGNAVSATKLQTARKINTIDFDGTEDIRIPCWNVGEKNASDSHNTYPVWMSMSQALGANGWPVNYGNVLTMRGLGDTQIVVEWNASQTEPGQNLGMNMFIRGRRDIIAGWSTFQKVATEGCDIVFGNLHANLNIEAKKYVTAHENWFKADASGTGLWNSAHDCLFYGTAYGWQANTSIHATNGLYKDSDIRLKSDIKDLNYTLDDILSIPTVSFNMDGKRNIGSIAQSLEVKFPELVSEGYKNKKDVPESDSWETFTGKSANGEDAEFVKVKTVEYEMLGVLALEGLKLLNRKVEDLKKQLNVK